MNIVFITSDSQACKYSCLIKFLTRRGITTDVIDIFSMLNLGLTEFGQLIQGETTINRSSLFINCLTELDLNQYISKIDPEDRDFAYSQWLAYLPSLINSFGKFILNRPSINRLNAISLDPTVNRSIFFTKGMTVPKEKWIVSINNVEAPIKNEYNYLVQDSKGNFDFINKLTLHENSYPITLFCQKNKPVPFFFFKGTIYTKDFKVIAINSAIYRFASTAFGLLEISFGICYLSFENNKIILWNIIPIIPDDILLSANMANQLSNIIHHVFSKNINNRV